jgi:hypothetical protein
MDRSDPTERCSRRRQAAGARLVSGSTWPKPNARYWDGNVWTNQVRPLEGQANFERAVRDVRSPTVAKPRAFTWVILVIDALFLCWILYAFVTAASTSQNCSSSNFANACRNGTEIGMGVSILFILLLAAAVNVVLGVAWFITREPEPQH